MWKIQKVYRRDISQAGITPGTFFQIGIPGYARAWPKNKTPGFEGIIGLLAINARDTRGRESGRFLARETPGGKITPHV